MKQYINRRDFLKAAGVTAAAAALAGCGVTSGSTATASSTAASSTAAAGKYDDVKADVTLTMSHQMAASHSINKTAEEFARLVAEKSEGKMKVDVYSAATLGTETENLQALAKAKGVPISAITACILDRPRHARLIDEVRHAGASIRLIGDGDIAGVIHTTTPDETGIDIYIGVGGAPEGVLAASALRCMGGQMQGRLVINRPDQIERALRMGITDVHKKYSMEDMAQGDVLFAATGVTDGNLLRGVKFNGERIITDTVVMRSSTGTVRWIRADHVDRAKLA